jgi:hypothetical protein
MKRTIVGIAVLIAITMASAAAVTAAAGKKGPYFAVPAWDRILAASKRFVVLSDWTAEAVLDRETGLVWQTNPAYANDTWEAAKRRCRDLIVANRRGWRLPSQEELSSLLDASFDFPETALPPGHPFVLPPSNQLSFWSATVVASPGNANISCQDTDGPCAWYVSFVGSGAQSAFPAATDLGLSTWCVRGGAGVNPQ